MTDVPYRRTSKLYDGQLSNEMNSRTELNSDFRVIGKSKQVYGGTPLEDISLTYSEDTYNDNEALGQSKNVIDQKKLHARSSQMRGLLVDRRQRKQDYSDIPLLDITLTRTEDSDDDSEVFGHIKNESGYTEQSLDKKPSPAPSPKVKDFLRDRRQRIQQIYAGIPLADIDMPQMEDSVDESQSAIFDDSYSSIPFDERSNYQHELIESTKITCVIQETMNYQYKHQESMKKIVWQNSKEEEESLIPFDEPPMPKNAGAQSIARSRADVRFCKSETCNACRRPRVPVFVPSVKAHREIRALAGTRWWEKDYDEDMISKWMGVFISWFGDSSGESEKTNSSKTSKKKKRNVPSIAEMVSPSFVCWSPYD